MKKLLTTLAAAMGIATSTFAALVDLSTVTAHTKLNDGDVATGTLGENVMIRIAACATVTLRDATINGVDHPYYVLAGLHCPEASSCTIILEGENVIRGYRNDWPGIYVPANSTLTIKGNGSLVASSNGLSLIHI